MRAHANPAAVPSLDPVRPKPSDVNPDLALTRAKGYYPSLQDDSLYAKFCQAAVFGILGTTSYVFMHYLNDTKITNNQQLTDAVYKRNKKFEGRGLITVSNHVSAFDDPLLPSAMWSIPRFLSPKELRYVFCLTDRCFNKWWKGRMLTSAKVVPVERGAGLDQFAMRYARQKLEHGDWIHLYPEGTRSRDGGKTVRPFKIGVGKLVLDSTVPPAVIPFYHTGMHKVLPVKAKSLRTGNQIHIMVGDPIFFDKAIEDHRKRGSTDMEIMIDITKQCEIALRELQIRAHEIQPHPDEESVAEPVERAA
eukprot:jgi/Bigna1/53559/estExt_Genewise1Plus.C_210051